MKQTISKYQEWENWFNSCKTRSDYYNFYSSNINNKENPFVEMAGQKLMQFKSYEKEFYDCWDSVTGLENYILKYIDSDNPYVHNAKNRIAELSKIHTPRWGLYRILLGILCLFLAITCLFIVLSVSGTSNSALAFIGLLAMAGIGLFTFGGLWLIFNGVKVLKNQNN